MTLEELRIEMDAAIAVVLPQTNGMDNLLRFPLSDETKVELRRELEDHMRRLALLRAVIVALDAVLTALEALKADGYPDMPKAEVTATVFAELQKALAEVEAALSEFELKALAAKLNISLGAKGEKP